MADERVLGLLGFGAAGWGDDLLFAAALTLQLAVLSSCFALVIGFVLASAKLSRWRLLRYLAATYTLFIRGVPEFLIILLVFFGSEALIQNMLTALGSDLTIEVPKFGAAVAALSLIFAAYACEVFRGAYVAVPPGQMEAAQAIGMRPFQAFIRIRFPQLWRFAIPGLGNLWMVVLKDTSLAAVIALNELLRTAKLAGETEHAHLMFFLAAGLIYLTMTSLSDILRRHLEQRARRGMAGG
ncbi:ABC transporter permease [Tritonibacter mobilis]|uniref:ABC transporter permease n=1 Tax=Tritonibacter mobilis TaxID=379347 RepID=UPI000806E34C|nr:ABC transporter permease subunit [Tritonibacter mobilis]